MAERAPDRWRIDPAQGKSGSIPLDERESAEGLRQLCEGIDSDRPVLAWLAPREPKCTRALDHLGEFLATPKRIIRTSVALVAPEELAARLLSALAEARRNEAAGRALARQPFDAFEPPPLLVLLEDSEALLPSTARWLTRLHGLTKPRVQLVLLGRSERLLRRVLCGPLADVELVSAAESQLPPGVALLRSAETSPPAPSPDAKPSPDFDPNREPREAAVDLEGVRYEIAPDRDEPWIVLSEEAVEQAGSTRAAPVVALPTRSAQPAAPGEAETPDIAGPSVELVSPVARLEPELRSTPTQGWHWILAFALACAALGFTAWALLWARPFAGPETSTPRSFVALEANEPTRRPIRAEGRRAASATRLRVPAVAAAPPSDVSYDPRTRQLRLRVEGAPLYRVLMEIAWQTGLRVETEIELEEKVDFEGAGLSLEEALGELLGDYQTLALNAVQKGEADPRTIWILARRSGSEVVDGALDALLAAQDPVSREAAARALEAAGRRVAGYGLLDLLARADARDAAEAQRLSDVRDGLRDTLCRAWSDTAVGPQARSLDCG